MSACMDCPPGSKRPLVSGSRRCATHNREAKKRAAEAAWAKRLLANFGLTPSEYWTLYLAQGGRCAICARSKGKDQDGKGSGKRLAVDHDHKTGRIRGLCCGKCNGILGWFRDDADSALRMHAHLTGGTWASTLGLDRVVPGGPDR